MTNTQVHQAMLAKYKAQQAIKTTINEQTRQLAYRLLVEAMSILYKRSK